jgi:hypothetical protein
MFNLKDYFNNHIQLKKIICLISIISLVIISALWGNMYIGSIFMGVLLSFAITTFPYMYHNWNKEFK